MKRAAFVFVLLILSVSLCSCGADLSLLSTVMGAAERTNGVKKYSADFLLEITNDADGELIVFAQGSYDADKTGAFKMSGTMVQTVNATPASLYIAYNDGKYYVRSGDVSTYTEIDESVFLTQFLCSEAIVFDDVYSIDKKSNGTGGTVYTFTADAGSVRDKLIPLVDTDVFYYAGMKKMRKGTPDVSGLSCIYVVDDALGMLSSRTLEYKEYAYDTAPYYPNMTVSDESLKYVLNIKIKITCKNLDGTANVVLPDFAVSGE